MAGRGGQANSDMVELLDRADPHVAFISVLADFFFLPAGDGGAIVEGAGP